MSIAARVLFPSPASACGSAAGASAAFQPAPAPPPRHLAGWSRLPGRLLSLLAILLLLLLCLWPQPALGLEGDSDGAAAAAGDAPAGAQLFSSHCAGCHINGGNIIRRGNTLRLEALRRNGAADPAVIARIAAAGVGQMAGYGAALGPGGSERVADWVWQQAQAGWPRS